jgi:hypothetical protein
MWGRILSMFKRREDRFNTSPDVPELVTHAHIVAEEAKHSADTVQQSLQPYREAENPLFALMTRAVNYQALQNDRGIEPHS